MYCGERTSVKHEGADLVLATMPCRAWTCPNCQPKRRGQLVHDVARGRPDTFITLTLPDKWATRPAEGVALLSHAWRLIRKREARRRGGPPLPFIAVVERTKTGTPHLHILTRSRWIDQKWLSNAMADIADAPIVDIRRIDHHGRVASYVAKYLGKDPTKVGTAKRYWQSRDYQVDDKPPKAPLPPGHWFDLPSRHPISLLIRDYVAMGCGVEWLTPKRCRVTNTIRGALTRAGP